MPVSPAWVGVSVLETLDELSSLASGSETMAVCKSRRDSRQGEDRTVRGEVPDVPMPACRVSGPSPSRKEETVLGSSALLTCLCRELCQKKGGGSQLQWFEQRLLVMEEFISTEERVTRLTRRPIVIVTKQRSCPVPSGTCELTWAGTLQQVDVRT